MRIPAIDILQDNTQLFAADLDSPLACWIGNGISDEDPSCDSMTTSDISQLGPQSCNCGSYFNHPVQPTWNGNNSKRVVTFRPGNELIISNPSTFFNLQVNFTYNTSTAGGNQIGSPSLWILIFDPTTDHLEAVEKGMASLMQFNANGVTNIMLDLNYYNVRALPPHYAYTPRMSTLPNLNLACDVAHGLDDVVPCHATLRTRFTSLQRTVYAEGRTMDWTSVAGAAASYFALVSLRFLR